jgi:hypothetical protein
MQPTLEVSTHAASLGNNGEVIGLRVVATDEKGKVGTGSVTLKAAAGLLGETELTLDSYGTATTVFSCDVSLDIDCSGSVEITAKWTTAQGVVTATTTVNARVSSTDGGSFRTDGGSENWLACDRRPQFKLRGPPGVAAGPLSLDSTNAQFQLRNSSLPIAEWWDFGPGQGVDIIVSPLPVMQYQDWHVMVFHSETKTTGQFVLGPFVPGNNGNNGSGVRVRGPSTSCQFGFIGGAFEVQDFELDDRGDVLHLNAQIHPKCPDPLNILPDTLSHGVICY